MAGIGSASFVSAAAATAAMIAWSYLNGVHSCTSQGSSGPTEPCCGDDGTGNGRE